MIPNVDDELSSELRSLRILIDSKYAEGIFGRADSTVSNGERDDEAVEISNLVRRLEERVNALPPVDARSESYLSTVRYAYRLFVPDERTRQAELVRKGIKEVYIYINRTSTQREMFKVLYNWVFHRNVAGPVPGVLGYNASRKSALSAYNMTTLGFLGWHRKPAFTWDASNPPNSILDTVRIQELTLRSLARRMVTVLQTAFRSSLREDNRKSKLIEEVGLVLQDTIINSRRYVQVRVSLECLIEQASCCIGILEFVVQSSKSPMPIEGAEMTKPLIERFDQNIRAWRNSLEVLSGLQAVADSSSGKTPGSLSNDLALYGSALAEEVWLWNATDDELSSWGSGQRVIPLDWLCRDGLRVVSDQLSYENICKKIEANLKVKVLFDHTPHNSTRQYSGVRGGFGCVKRVNLEHPIECKVFSSVQLLMGWSTTELISEVAVKVIYVGESEQATCLRIAREARAWAQLKHDHINPLLGLWINFEGSNIPCFVSPWASQGSLPRFLRNNPNASALQRLQIVRDVADALAFMHGQMFPVVHGDLRGSNVLIHHNKALVCDFGISYITDGLTGTTTAVHGSWKWWAPEYFHTSTDNSFEGNHAFKPTPQADVYSFASVFVETFTGREPWVGVNMTDRAVRRSDVEPQPKEICEHHWAFLTECWSPDPLLRPTAREVFEKMQTFVREADIEVID